MAADIKKVFISALLFIGFGVWSLAFGGWAGDISQQFGISGPLGRLNGADIREDLLMSMFEAGFEKPSPIQEKRYWLNETFLLVRRMAPAKLQHTLFLQSTA